jgi:hypothetical protein
MPTVRQGDFIPLSLKLYDERSDRYVRAYLTDSNGNPLPQSPVNLTHVGFGLYENRTIAMPNVEHVTAVYVVYSDAGYTIEDENYTHGVDLFELHVPDFVILTKLNEIKNICEKLAAQTSVAQEVKGIVQLADEISALLSSNKIEAKVLDEKIETQTSDKNNLSIDLNDNKFLLGEIK